MCQYRGINLSVNFSNASEVIKVSVRQKNLVDYPAMLKRNLNQFLSFCTGINDETMSGFLVRIEVAVSPEYAFYGNSKNHNEQLSGPHDIAETLRPSRSVSVMASIDCAPEI